MSKRLWICTLGGNSYCDLSKAYKILSTKMRCGEYWVCAYFPFIHDGNQVGYEILKTFTDKEKADIFLDGIMRECGCDGGSGQTRSDAFFDKVFPPEEENEE